MLIKEERLTKQKDIENVFKKGKALFSEIVKIKTITNKLNTNRYAIVVSNKVNKKAVERNKIKRIIREIIKETKVVKGRDVLIITTKEINKTNKPEIKQKLKKLLLKI